MSAERWDRGAEMAAGLARLDFADRAVRCGDYLRAAAWIDAFIRWHRVTERRAWEERPRITPVGNFRDLLATVPHVAGIVALASFLSGCGSIVAGPSSLVTVDHVTDAGAVLEAAAEAPPDDATPHPLEGDAGQPPPPVDAGAAEAPAPVVVDAAPAAVDVGREAPPCSVAGVICPIGGGP